MFQPSCKYLEYHPDHGRKLHLWLQERGMICEKAVFGPFGDEGFRDDTGVFWEPMPNPIERHEYYYDMKYDGLWTNNLRSCTKDKFTCFDYDYGTGVYRKEVVNGQTFCIQEAFFFTIYNITRGLGRFQEWASHYNLDLTVIPKLDPDLDTSFETINPEENDHRRVFCFFKPKTAQHHDFKRTFRAWIILKEHDRLFQKRKTKEKARHLGNAIPYFFDFIFCHDNLATSIGKNTGDMNRFCRMILARCPYTYYWTEEKKLKNTTLLKTLWARFLWHRIRVFCRAKIAALAVFQALHIEVLYRPGGQGFQKAKCSFESMC